MENQSVQPSTPQVPIPQPQSIPPETPLVPPTKKISKTLIIILVLLFLTATGVVGYFVYQNYQPKKQTPQPQSSLLPIATTSPINTPTTTSPVPIPDPTADWKTYKEDSCEKIQSLIRDTAFSVTKSFCEKCGGNWGLGPHRDGCNPPALDFDKVCTDNSQCEGLCLTKKDNEKAIVGKCSQYKIVFGCNIEIVNSKAQPMLCRD